MKTKMKNMVISNLVLSSTTCGGVTAPHVNYRPSKRAKIRTLPLKKRLIYDAVHDGQGDTGIIEGVVLEKNKPVIRRVNCYLRRTGALVYSVMSSDTGSFTFKNLIAGVEYYVVSLNDSQGGVIYEPVFKDRIIATDIHENMVV